MPHEFFIRRCLQLAEHGRGKVGNGALVGSVLVRDGTIIAEGYHAEFGKAHAERQLLEKYEQEIRSTDTLYASLEPCCHTGKTPPCTDILIKRGIKRVVFGMVDPDPRMAGKGMAVLRKAGIEVIGPVIPSECRRFNRGYVSVRTNQRPWITLKRAQTAAGEVANPDGSTLKITSPDQDRWSHQFLRAKHDAILVGIGTVLKDNPQLTIRLKNSKFQIPNSILQPWRIILDPQLRMPITAKLVSDAHANRTIIVIRPKLDKVRKSVIPLLEARGIRIIEVPDTKDGFDFPSLWKALITPTDGFHGLTSILVEGGERTWQSFKRAGVVDEEVTLVGN